MRKPDLQYFVCPITQEKLIFDKISKTEDDHIIEGTLTTPDSKLSYAITRGVPNFMKPLESQVTREQDETHELFGHEWELFKDWGWLDELPDEPDAQLRYHGALKAHTKGAFHGKTLLTEGEIQSDMLILDGGCGNGRFIKECRKQGPTVIGIDAGESVYVSFRKMKDDPGVIIARGSLLKLPFPDELFDITYTIGVLQHTGDAFNSLHELRRVLKAGGFLAFNCYGKGLPTYELIDKIIRSFITGRSRKHQLDFARKIARFDRALRKNPFGRMIRKFIWPHINILPTEHHMFDWYSPKLANHYDRSDLLRWFDKLELEPIRTSPDFINSTWSEFKRRINHASYSVLTNKPRNGPNHLYQ